jgi:hypothetical protein
MVAVSPDESGSEALEWLMESLIEDGDEIVAVRVIELDEGEKASKEAQEGFRELNDEVSDRRVSLGGLILTERMGTDEQVGSG